MSESLCQVGLFFFYVVRRETTLCEYKPGKGKWRAHLWCLGTGKKEVSSDGDEVCSFVYLEGAGKS